MISPKMTMAMAAGVLNISLQAVHKRLKSKDMAFEKVGNRIYFGHTTARELLALPFPSNPKVISFQIVKGGPGKTSMTKSVGIAANIMGARVLLIDLDQQGNMTRDLLAKPTEYKTMLDVITDEIPFERAIVPIQPGLDLLPSHLKNAILDNTLVVHTMPVATVYKRRIDAVRDNYDLILIDCPPAFSASTHAAALASDLIIPVVAPEPYCLDGLTMTVTEIQKLKKLYGSDVPIKVILNKYNHSKALSREILQELLQHPFFAPRMFATPVRESQDFSNASRQLRSIFCQLRDTIAKEDVINLTKEVLGLADYKVTEEESVPLGSLDGISKTKRINQPEATL
ncbi:ParA family protein [Bdellovibrionota bacterium FG-2]